MNLDAALKEAEKISNPTSTGECPVTPPTGLMFIVHENLEEEDTKKKVIEDAEVTVNSKAEKTTGGFVKFLGLEVKSYGVEVKTDAKKYIQKTIEETFEVKTNQCPIHKIPIEFIKESFTFKTTQPDPDNDGEYIALENVKVKILTEDSDTPKEKESGKDYDSIENIPRLQGEETKCKLTELEVTTGTGVYEMEECVPEDK